MKKLGLFIAMLLTVSQCYAAPPTRQAVYTTQTTISSSDVTANEDAMFTYLQNGVDTYSALSIANAAVSATAGIDGSKLDLTGGTTDITASGDIDFDGGTFTFNDSSADLDFRCESDDTDDIFFIDGGADRIGIGTATPEVYVNMFGSSAGTVSHLSGTLLGLELDANCYISVLTPNDKIGGLILGDEDNNDAFLLKYNHITPIATVDIENVNVADWNTTALTVSGGFCVSGAPAAYATATHIDDSTHGAASTTLYIGDETINTTDPSDESVKKNVKDTKYKLSDLKKIKVKDYKYKNRYKGKDDEGQPILDDSEYTGMIAQDIETIFPEVVFTRTDGLKAIDYNKLIPIIIQAIQDLEERVEILEND